MYIQRKKSSTLSAKTNFDSKKMTYGERARLCANPAARRLLEIMEQKQTNLAHNPDVTTKAEFLELVEAVGPYICLLKTHIDILVDFDWDVIEQLKQLARKHNFLIFEDRKFADIGNTVKMQYADGIYKIAEWADIVNAHTVPGPGIIKGLQDIGGPKGRGLILLAQMSSQGTLASGEYTKKSVAMAEQFSDFVIGFITREKLCEDPQFIYFAPGVQLTQGGDGLGQQFLTPDRVIGELGCDVIIVGRGIYKSEDPAEFAQEYQRAGWDAYQKRIKE